MLSHLILVWDMYPGWSRTPAHPPLSQVVELEACAITFAQGNTPGSRDMIEMFNPCPQVCGAVTGFFLLCWVSSPQLNLTMHWTSHTVSLFTGCLAGSRDSQKGHTREFDGHCLDGLAGRVMVGPCWGQGKPGPVLISDVRVSRSCLWDPLPFLRVLQPADFPVAKQGDQPGSGCLSGGSGCF